MTLFLDPSKTNLSPSDQVIVDDLYAHVRALETVVGENKDTDWLDQALNEARNAISLEAHAILASWQSTLGNAQHQLTDNSGIIQTAVDEILRRLGVNLPPSAMPGTASAQPVELNPSDGVFDPSPVNPLPPAVDITTRDDNPNTPPYNPPSSFAEPTRSGGV